MRIARIATGTGNGFAAGHADGGWVPLPALGVDAATTEDVIAAADRVRSGLDGFNGETVAADTALACPIVRPSKMMAIGLNYADHIAETGATAPERPLLFAKFPSSLVGPADDVVLDPDLTTKGDYEVELAVVIGRRTRRASEAEALDAVFGYTVANDVSARDWQRADGQFDRSKGFDTFCPIGPWLTTADEVADPQSLALRTWVNDEPRQDSSTSQMVFGVASLIAFLSRGMTLEPGDVLLTGTPPGVGLGMDPPRFLAQGDVVRCEIEGLGTITNRLVPPPT